MSLELLPSANKLSRQRPCLLNDVLALRVGVVDATHVMRRKDKKHAAMLMNSSSGRRDREAGGSGGAVVKKDESTGKRINGELLGRRCHGGPKL